MTHGSDPSSETFARFISTHLPLRDVPELGIALHLAQPQSGLTRFLGPNGSTPYWAYSWAGGLALARHLIAHPDLVSGRTVLDFGAGSGLVGIVAARLAARAVYALEIDPLARRAIGLNACANTVSITVIAAEPDFQAPPPIDLVLAGDVFYDTSVVAPVLAALDRANATGIAVLVGDPGRASLPRPRLEPIASYRVADVGYSPGASAPGQVFRLLAQDRQSHFDATFDS